MQRAITATPFTGLCPLLWRWLRCERTTSTKRHQRHDGLQEKLCGLLNLPLVDVERAKLVAAYHGQMHEPQHQHALQQHRQPNVPHPTDPSFDRPTSTELSRQARASLAHRSGRVKVLLATQASVAGGICSPSLACVVWAGLPVRVAGASLLV